MSASRLVFGMDIGGTRTKYGLIDLDQRAIRVQQTLPTETGGQAALVQHAARTMLELCQQAGVGCTEICGGGIGVPGYVDGDEISLVWESLAFLEGSTFRAALQSALGFAVRMDNDARIIALGETYFGGHAGAGRGAFPRRLLSLTLGTGLGVALVTDGVLQEKSSVTHMAGHIPIRLGAAPCFCGFAGCLESLVGGASLPRNYQHALSRLNLPPDARDLDGRQVFQLAAEGLPAAVQAVKQMLIDLTCGLNAYIYLYGPQVIVLGGGTADSLGPWLATLCQGLFARPYAGYTVAVNQSRLGDQAGLLGAAVLGGV